MGFVGGGYGGCEHICKNGPDCQERIHPNDVGMPGPSDSRPTSRTKLLLFLLAFIGTAAWGGYVLAKYAHLRGSRPANPIEDRSLFGR